MIDFPAISVLHNFSTFCQINSVYLNIKRPKLVFFRNCPPLFPSTETESYPLSMFWLSPPHVWVIPLLLVSVILSPSFLLSPRPVSVIPSQSCFCYPLSSLFLLSPPPSFCYPLLLVSVFLLSPLLDSVIPSPCFCYPLPSLTFPVNPSFVFFYPLALFTPLLLVSVIHSS